ncbi:MAG: TonB-dependent receptor, partial [Bacteroidota bacterium]
MPHRSLNLLSLKTNWFAILLGALHMLHAPNCFAKDSEEAPRKIPRYTVSGYLRGQNGENLLGATVQVKGAGLGTASNTYGYYALTLDSGTHVLSVQYLGYKSIRQIITLVASKQINFTLQETSIQAAEVVVLGRREDANVTQGRMSVSEVDIKQVKSLPALMGEADILKTIQLLPGIKNGGEGTTGFYVRGGGPDQNLILLDEAVVYNASHLFGFFSVFNADALANSQIIKGGMPAEYGGRISSVLDLSMREGNNQKFVTQGGLGLIASRFTTEGPLKQGKASYILSGRRTYLDVLVDPLIPEDAPAKGSGYYFYDLNAKINWQPSPKDRLYASAYLGKDVFNFNNRENGFQFDIPWGNTTATLRWNRILGPRVFVNHSLIYSDFNFGTGFKQNDFQLRLNSGVRNVTLKQDFDIHLSSGHRLKAGSQWIRHWFLPSVVQGRTGEFDIQTNNIPRLNAIEWAAYLRDEWDINEQWQINAGLRFAMFQQYGPYSYERYKDLSLVERLDSVGFASGRKVVFYPGWEPRFNLRYLIDNQSSFKVGITRNLQFIHLASSSGTSLPADLWIPSTLKVKPQIGIQYAAGYFRNFASNTYETSVELYYKDLRNQIDFREGAINGFNPLIENDLVFGRGEAYGAEFLLKKAKGALSGWIGYTLSWTNRNFPDIMNGKTYPYKFDRRHDLSVVASWNQSPRWKFSGTFVFSTGNAYTLPESRYFFEGQIIDQIGERNSFRLPNYHRLDFSAVYTPRAERFNQSPNAAGSEPRLGKRSRYLGEWVFAVYNIYSRLNPFFIYLDNEGSLQQNSLKV